MTSDLLKKRIKEFAIPPAALNRQPLWDKVIIWRLDTREEKTAGGLYIPEKVTHKDGTESDLQTIISHRGVLLKAGLRALDSLRDYEVELGHIVHFGRYAGQDETVVKRGAGAADEAHIVVLSLAEITSSEDLALNLSNGTASIEYDDATGQHHMVNKDEGVRRGRSDLKEVAA